jgi:Fe-S-cluster containining protein
VPLFGHDVWWIATRRGMSPESFAFIAEQETPDPLGFRLGAGPTDPTYGLALLKVEPLAASQPCIFLEFAGDGTSRCGIYVDRPITCQTYPMAKLGARVYQRERTLCPTGSWPEDELDVPVWTEKLQRLRYRRDVYVEVVARWNAAVAHVNAADSLPAKAFCQFVLAVYQQIHELEDGVGATALSAIERGWANLAPRSAGLASTGEVAVGRVDEPAWISHLREVRGVIDRFFPGLPPLPFQPLVIESAAG